MDRRTRGSPSLPAFFALVLVASIPFWLARAAPEDLVPRVPLIDLPMSALVAFAPMIAALILVSRAEGAEGAKRLLLLAFFAIFFVTAIGEELGWTGYATDPMQARRSAFTAGLLLGAIWALWHSVTFLQTTDPLSWIVCTISIVTFLWGPHTLARYRFA